MIAWLTNNAVTIVVTAVLLIMIGLAVFSLMKDKKKKGCVCNCSDCSMKCSCNKK